MRRTAVIILFVTLALAFSVQASELNASKISSFYYIEYGKVLVDTTILFDHPVSGDMEFSLPLDARAITMHADGIKVDPSLDGNVLSYSIEEATRLRYQYISEAFLESDSFLANVLIPVDSEQLVIRVALPENALLVSAADSQVPSVLPKPTRLETDGRVIDVIWHADSVSEGQELPMIVRYEIPGRSVLLWIWVFAVAFAVILTGYNLLKRTGRNPPKVIVIKDVKHSKEGFNLEKHLKEDEEQIVTILRDRAGECEQGTLRVITGFSKAKLSGLLKELEDRKVVHKEKRGKKNLVFLKG